MRYTGTAGLALCVLLAFAGDLPAQASGEADAEDTLCFQPGPLPTCTAFLLTEFNFIWPGVWNATGGDQPPLVMSRVGLVRNIGERHAVGGEVFRGARRDLSNAGRPSRSDIASRHGAMARYRFRATPDLAIDLSPGFYVFSRQYMGTRLRLTGEAAVTYRELGVSLHADSGPDGPVAYIGIKFGALPGALGALLVGWFYRGGS